MIEESSWFGTQLQSISKERLLPTRDSLLGIIRRKKGRWTVGFMRHMGHVSTALVACKTGCVGWHMVPWILETTNLQSFLNKGKGLVYGLPAWRSAHEKGPGWAPVLPVHFLLFILSPPPLPPPHLPLLLLSLSSQLQYFDFIIVYYPIINIIRLTSVI